MSQPASPLVGVHYAVPQRRQDDAWEINEEPMPESVLHDAAVDLLKALLSHWATTLSSTSDTQALVARNLAVRWDEERPNVGVDPDVCVLRPPPHEAHTLSSVRTWLHDHHPPVLAVEVVSETNARKDYAIAPDKYAASGTGELWIFDPLLAGPTSHGGPHRLQLWSRRQEGVLARVYAGPGPVFSPTLGAWLVVSSEGQRLRIADDEAATRFWLTAEEAERAAKEQERAAKERALVAAEQERTAKEVALARIAELEDALRSRPSE